MDPTTVRVRIVSSGLVGFRSVTAWQAPTGIRWFGVLVDGADMPIFVSAADLEDVQELVTVQADANRIRDYLDTKIAVYKRSADLGDQQAAAIAAELIQVQLDLLWQDPANGG